MPESKGRKRAPRAWGRLIVLLLVLAGVIAWRLLRRGH
jgi:hypothetical protein